MYALTDSRKEFEKSYWEKLVSIASEKLTVELLLALTGSCFSWHKRSYDGLEVKERQRDNGSSGYESRGNQVAKDGESAKHRHSSSGQLLDAGKTWKGIPQTSIRD